MTSPAEASETAAAVQAWTQWRRRCAVGLCDPPVREALHRFAFRRARSWCTRLGGAARGFTVPAGPDAWHRLETHMTVVRSRRGAPYKQWLFARAEGLCGGDFLNAVQGGATLLLRDVLREWMRQEAAAPAVVSLEAPLPNLRGLCLLDLLPADADPAGKAAERDLEEIGRREAAEAWAQAGRPARVGLCLRAAGLPLYGQHPEKLAGCGKSRIYAEVQQFVRRLADDLRRRHGPNAFDLACRALAHARDLALEWGCAENILPAAFQQMERAGRSRRPRKETAL